MLYHPWRRLRELAHIRLEWHDSDDELGRFDFDSQTVSLTVGMTQAERRSVLTHELIHQERGPVSPAFEAVEERTVERLTAERLIPFDDLVEAMFWCYGEHELAEHFQCELAVAVTRLQNLTAAESHFINEELDRRELRTP